MTKRILDLNVDDDINDVPLTKRRKLSTNDCDWSSDGESLFDSEIDYHAIKNNFSHLMALPIFSNDEDNKQCSIIYNVLKSISSNIIPNTMIPIDILKLIAFNAAGETRQCTQCQEKEIFMINDDEYKAPKQKIYFHYKTESRKDYMYSSHNFDFLFCEECIIDRSTIECRYCKRSYPIEKTVKNRYEKFCKKKHCRSLDTNDENFSFKLDFTNYYDCYPDRHWDIICHICYYQERYQYLNLECKFNVPSKTNKCRRFLWPEEIGNIHGYQNIKSIQNKHEKHKNNQTLNTSLCKFCGCNLLCLCEKKLKNCNNCGNIICVFCYDKVEQQLKCQICTMLDYSQYDKKSDIFCRACIIDNYDIIVCQICNIQMCNKCCKQHKNNHSAQVMCTDDIVAGIVPIHVLKKCDNCGINNRLFDSMRFTICDLCNKHFCDHCWQIKGCQYMGRDTAYEIKKKDSFGTNIICIDCWISFQRNSHFMVSTEGALTSEKSSETTTAVAIANESLSGGCDNCGKNDDLNLCDGCGSECCQECLEVTTCVGCGLSFCWNCSSSTKCYICDNWYCEKCIDTCQSCGRYHCNQFECASYCIDCRDTFCNGCIKQSSHCCENSKWILDNQLKNAKNGSIDA